MIGPNPRRARALRILSLSAAAGLVFTLGVVAGASTRTATADGGSRYRALDLFAQVFAHVENLYVDDVPREELAHGAIEGLVGKLDPHSAFLRPELYRAMKEETSGEFEGVGLELGLRDARLTVVAPLAGSPGARAGIEPGDRLLSIDGVPTDDMPLAEAVRRLKGRAGSSVKLGLQRALVTSGADRRRRFATGRLQDAAQGRQAFHPGKAFDELAKALLVDAFERLRELPQGSAAHAASGP